MSTDLTNSFLQVKNDIADFYHGMTEYWSTRTLMQGYGEAARDITELAEEATKDSNPLVQSCVGSGLGVAKMLGAIPIGIDHWVMETAKAVVYKGWGEGFKTLLATPIEGFIDGGKFVISQAKRWSQGEISNSTMGVADEVATTLGTAGLMFLGIKAIHTGGTGMINGLKNIELPTPALVTPTGHVMPVVLESEAFSGMGPMTEGLVYMSATSKTTEVGSSGGSPKWDAKKFAEKALNDDQALVALQYMAKEGDIKALQALLDLAKQRPSEKILKALGDYFERKVPYQYFGHLDLFSEAEVAVMKEFHGLEWGENAIESAKRTLENEKEIPLENLKALDKIQTTTTSLDQKTRILTLKSATGDIQALEALGELTKRGEISQWHLLNLFDCDQFGLNNIAARLKAFDVFKKLPDLQAKAREMAGYGLFQRVPPELGTAILDWLIQESVKDPEIAVNLVKSGSKAYLSVDFEKWPVIWANADFSPLYAVAGRDTRYGNFLKYAYGKVERSSPKVSELEGVLTQIGIDLRRF